MLYASLVHSTRLGDPFCRYLFKVTGASSASLLRSRSAQQVNRSHFPRRRRRRRSRSDSHSWWFSLFDYAHHVSPSAHRQNCKHSVNYLTPRARSIALSVIAGKVFLASARVDSRRILVTATRLSVDVLSSHRQLAYFVRRHLWPAVRLITSIIPWRLAMTLVPR